jgi:hypothetical protein
LPHAQHLSESVEVALTRSLQSRPQQVVASAKVVQQHARRGPRRAHEWIQAMRKSVLKRVIDAGVKEAIRDVRLTLSTHTLIFSRNKRYM